ncbi:hypothetical protein D9M72_211170 [compost metagenome]
MTTGDEALGGTGQGGGAIGEGAVDDAEVELAADALLEHVGVHAEGLHRRQQALGRLVDGHTLLGQAEATAAALAELDPEAGLQVAHLFADGGLTGIQGRLGSGKAPAFDDRGEDPKQLQVDIVQLDHVGLPLGELHRYLRYEHLMFGIFTK